MKIENIKLFRLNSKNRRHIEMRIKVRNNRNDIAPKTLRINNLSLCFNPLLMNKSSITKPANTTIQPIIQDIKTVSEIKPKNQADSITRGKKSDPVNQ
jgi:hypothetical protein